VNPARTKVSIQIWKTPITTLRSLSLSLPQVRFKTFPPSLSLSLKPPRRLSSLSLSSPLLRFSLLSVTPFLSLSLLRMVIARRAVPIINTRSRKARAYVTELKAH